MSPSIRKSVVQSACQYNVTSRVSDFQNGEQGVHRKRRIKISNLSRKYCSDLDLEILRSLFLKKTRLKNFFGVINFRLVNVTVNEQLRSIDNWLMANNFFIFRPYIKNVFITM